MLSRHGAAHLYTRELAARVAGQQAGDAASAVVAATSLAISPAQFTREVDTQLRPLLASTGLKPGARRLVSHLARHGVPAAVATSSRRTNSCVKMSRHRDLFSLFSHAVYGSDDPAVARGKPDPDIFLVAASRFPEAPSPGEAAVWIYSPDLLLSLFRELPGVRGQRVRGAGGAGGGDAGGGAHSSTGHGSPAMFDQSYVGCDGAGAQCPPGRYRGPPVPGDVRPFQVRSSRLR